MANVVEIILKATDKTGGVLGKAGLDLSKLSEQFTRMGSALTKGVTLPLVGIGTLAVKTASDLEESMSKVNVVFDQAAISVQNWAMSSATSFGISRQKALEAAGTYGNLFVTMGLTSDAAADMSTELVELAADLASFNNLTPEEVLTKLRSGLVGEVEPLRALGVNLTAATVQAKAMEMGLADADGQLSQSALLQARYALILEQTTTAQGDFARTADGLANSTRIARAELEDAAAQLGTQLLPIATQLIHKISELVSKFTALSPETQKVIVVAAGLAAAVGPLLLVVGQAITIFGALSSAVSAAGPVLAAIAAVLTGPVGLAIAAVVAAVGLLYWAWKKNIGGIQGIISNAVIIIKELFQRIVNLIRNAMNLDWGAIGRSVIHGIANGIRSGIASIVNAARDAAQSALNAAKRFLGIRSPSNVFAGIGKNMMLGLAQGVGQFSQVPVNMTVEATRAVTRVAAGGGAPALAADNSQIVRLLRELLDKPSLNEAKLARLITTAFLREAG